MRKTPLLVSCLLLLSPPVAACAQVRNAHDTLQALIQELESPDAYVRASAAWALEDVELAAGEAVPALLDALRDKADEVRWRAAGALGKMGRAPVPGLILLLRDTDPKVRKAAVGALTNIGPDAKDAAGNLVSLLESADEPVETRTRAAYALGKIGLA